MGQGTSKSIAKTVQRTANKLQEQAGKAATSAPPSVSQPPAGDGGGDGGGFLRGEGPLSSEDEKQLQHLRRQQQYEARTVPSEAAPPAAKEIDPELLSFLQDQGPLERKIDKELTSKRLLRETLKPLDEPDQVSPADDRRISEETPISAFDTKHTTKRTTNFSRGLSAEDLENEKKFGLEVDEMFNLLVGKDSHSTDNMSETDEELLRQTKATLGVPTILRDLDNSYVGAWPENVAKLELLNLQPVHKSQIMLSVEAWQVREASVMSRMDSRSKERTPKSESVGGS